MSVTNFLQEPVNPKKGRTANSQASRLLAKEYVFILAESLLLYPPSLPARRALDEVGGCLEPIRRTSLSRNSQGGEEGQTYERVDVGTRTIIFRQVSAVISKMCFFIHDDRPRHHYLVVRGRYQEG